MASLAAAQKQAPLLPPPPFGHAVPPNEHHAISVQISTWEDMKGLPLRSERVEKAQKGGYPRSYLHADVRKVHGMILDAAADSEGLSCLAFPTWVHANACLQLVKSRDPNARARVVEAFFDANACPSQSKIYATIYHPTNHSAAFDFWRYTGTGISSRFAESIWKRSQALIVTDLPNEPEDTLGDQGDPRKEKDPGAEAVRQRICDLLQRASLNPDISNKVTSGDVYLYPSGMSAIYHCSQMLNAWRDAESLVFGFLYELTPRLLDIYSSSTRVFGFGTQDEMEELQRHLVAAKAAGRAVQSVWCECPSNPLLHTVDYRRLRQLADEHDFVLIVDETIGNFANVDLLSVADILVTSLSKSFSGCADVMGGSIVLNPHSKFYGTLNDIMVSTHVPNLHPLDAAVLERNSRPFLARTARMNRTAAILVALVSSYAALSESTVTKVYHPSTLASGAHFTPFLRRSTPELTPGYGALFTIEFDSEKSASIFFDNLDIHKGPSLGAGVTLAQPYVQTVFAREKEWAASYGLHESIIRISAGLEDADSLVRMFRQAIHIADQAKLGNSPRADSIIASEP